MLRRTTRACRCASTSRAPPCRHSHSSPSPNPPSSGNRSDEIRPLDYAAPLYQPGSRSTKWFSALRLGWNGWRGRDGSPHTGTTPPSFPSASSSFLPDLSFGFRPPPPPTPLLEDQPLSQLSHYLTSRGPRGHLSAFEPEDYDALLETAERGDMPLLGAMVKEDLQLRGMGARQRGQLQMERLRENKRAVLENGLGGNVKLAETQMPEEKKVLAAPVRKESKEKAVEVNEAVKALEVEVAKVVEVEAVKQEDAVEAVGVEEPSAPMAEQASPPSAKPFVLDFAYARSLFSSLSSSDTLTLPAEISHASPRLKKAEQLSLVWDTFAAEADLSHSPADLRLALSFMHYLSAPSATSSSPPAAHLSLSLRILDSLLSFLPDTVVAAEPPSSPSLPQTARVQAVLLRTLANIALGEADNASPADAQAFLALSARALLSFDTLRSSIPSSATLPVDETDLARLRSTTTALISSLSAERVFTYRSSALPSARPSPTSSLALTASLLSLHSTTRWNAPTTPAELEKHLDAFAVEAAERYRWDLLARVWDEWNNAVRVGEQGWVLKRDHLKLARWLAGEAPVGTYPSLATAEGKKADVVAPVRPVQTYVFNRFATQTYRFLRSEEGSAIASRWTLTDKNDYLLFLTSSSASTPHTRSLARRLTTYWLSPSTSAKQPFLLSAPSFLSLIRTSLPPHTRTTHRALLSQFAKPLILTHIRLLISPTSPFSRPLTISSGKLDHFDLTTLAQAYAIVRDWGSMGEVYGQILAQKILPDRKDVGVVVQAGPRILDARKAPMRKTLGEKWREEEQQRKERRGSYRIDADGNPAKLAQLAASQGLVLRDVEVWLELIRGVVEGELALRDFADRVEIGGKKAVSWDSDEGRRNRLRNQVERVVSEARRAGLKEEEVQRLREFAKGFIPLQEGTITPHSSASDPSSSDSHLSPTVLRAQLRSLLSATPSSTSTSLPFPTPSLPIFRSNLPSADDTSLALLLRCALQAWESSRRGNAEMRRVEREKVREGVRELAGLFRREEGVERLVRTAETVDLLLRVLMKADDIQALDRVMAHLSVPSPSSPAALPQPSENVLASVVRWAIAKEGRERLLDPQSEVGSGWVGEKVREVVDLKGLMVKERRQRWQEMVERKKLVERIKQEQRR